MDSIEQKASKLWLAEMDAFGGREVSVTELCEASLRAIRRALEQREAVPVAEVLGWNNDATPKLRINVKLHQIPVGTRLYPLTAPPSKEE